MSIASLYGFITDNYSAVNKVAYIWRNKAITPYRLLQIKALKIAIFIYIHTKFCH